jgi:hypothetical protein
VAAEAAYWAPYCECSVTVLLAVSTACENYGDMGVSCYFEWYSSLHGLLFRVSKPQATEDELSTTAHLQYESNRPTRSNHRIRS